METLDEFVTAKEGKFPFAAYVTYPGFSDLYVRRSKFRIAGDWCYNFVTLANMTAENPGNGALSRLLKHLFEDLEKNVAVECIQNERLVKKLEREGWVRYGELPPSFYKLNYLE